MPQMRRIHELPSALAHRRELERALSARRPAVFLDYDGSLTPIVPRPEDARLPDATRSALERLRTRCPVAIVSGRDLADVKGMVGIEGIWYAGSHGFDLEGPQGQRHRRGEEYAPALDRAEAALRERLGGLAGVRVERKAFALAVHWREAEPRSVPEVGEAVEEVARRSRALRKTDGKKIFELRPAIEWDKGKALLWLLELLGLDSPEVLPIYIGDDVTDEDAFRALAGRGGIGLVVRGEDDERETAAAYALEDPEEARRLLEALADAVGAPREA